MKFLLIIPALLAVILLLLLIAVIRTLLMPSKKSDYKADEDEKESMHLAEKLSTMIKYDTTSHAGIDEHEKFLGFHIFPVSPFCAFYLFWDNFAE